MNNPDWIESDKVAKAIFSYLISGIFERYRAASPTLSALKNTHATHTMRKRPSHPQELPPSRQPPAFTDGVGGIAPVLPTQQQRQEQRGMNAAPNDERPVGAVPKSAHEEDDEDVADGFPFPTRDPPSGM